LGKIIFKNDIPGILTAYNDLLKRGIDPLQFIKGLGDFFRNLMLAKDPNTLALMELGEDVKKNYQEATEPLTTEYLLDAIALINSFEINYKSVNNKRVHVELSLMQLASLHFNGEKKKTT
jgi:DNA polymerase-3 subunit gamma/tau